MSLEGYNGQKASFSLAKGRIDIRQVGHALLYLKKHDEYYLITLPSLHIEGLWSGAPFVELNKHTFITSSSGFTSKIDYSGRGWLSGKKNSFTAVMYPDGKEKDTLYTVEGQWTGEFDVKDGKTKKTVDHWVAKENPTSKFLVAPLDQQDPLESRRAWRKVADAQIKSDMNTLSNEKSLIENSQRDLRKKEKAEGAVWKRIFFSNSDKDQVFEKLGSKISEPLEADKTDGVWRFDVAKAKEAKSPYRPGTMPEGI